MESKFGHDPVSGARWEIHGPAKGIPIVEAWADDYIRFDGRPPWQEELRDDIRSRCRLLEPTAEQVLQALQKMAAHGVYALYLERIAYFRAHPLPPDWDGVTTFETK